MASATVLRELLFKLGLDVDEAQFAKGQIAASILVGVLHKGVEVVQELGRAFIENLHQSIQYGDHIHKLAQEVGVSEQALQELAYAGKLGDVGLEELAASAGKLAVKMKEAKGGSDEAGKALHGIPFKDAQGNLLGVDQVMANVADKFAALPDGAEKTAMAIQIFGRAGKAMIPMLNKGSEELNRMREEAREMGLVMDGEATKAAEEIEDNFKRLEETTKGLWRGAIAPLLPAVSALVKAFLEWKKQNAAKIMELIRGAASGLIKTLRFLLDVFKFLVDNAAFLKILLGVGGLVTIMHSLSVAAVESALKTAAAWALAAAPFLLIGAIVAGLFLLFDDLRTYAQGGDSLFGRFEKQLQEWSKGTGEDKPYWLKWMIEFVERIKDAIKYWSDFKSGFGNWQDLKDVLGDKLFRGGPAQAMTVEEYRRQNPDVRVPEMRSANNAGSTLSNSTVVNAPINIYQQPGEDSEALASRVADHLETNMFTAAVPAVK